MFRHREAIWVVALFAQGCFNPTGCIPLPRLPDGGFFDAGFDGSFAETLIYDQTVGDPVPILDGGSTVFGSLVFTTTFDGGARIETVTMGPGGPKLETLVFSYGDDTAVVGTADMNLDGVIDYQYTSTFDGLSTFNTTVLTDSDFDGVLDSQDVWVVDVDGGRPFSKTETFSR